MNPWAILAGVGAALALALGGYFYGHHVESLAFEAFKAQKVAAAEKQVVSNHDAVAAISASEAAGLRTISATQQEQINDLTQRRDALVANNDDLARRLQQHLARPGKPAASVPQAATGTGRPDAAGDATLSVGLQQFTGWLTQRFYEADTLAVRLTAAQAVIQQDREICNGSLPGLTK